MRKKPKQDVVVCPFEILCDSREGLPYSFKNFRSDADTGNVPLIVKTVTIGLPTGDYTIMVDGESFEDKYAVERKEFGDFVGSMGGQRARFEREIERMNDLRYGGAICVETEWSEIIYDPPIGRRLNPKTIYRSVIAWQFRYPKVHWWFVPGREWGERTTYRLLDRFFKEHCKATDLGVRPDAGRTSLPT